MIRILISALALAAASVSAAHAQEDLHIRYGDLDLSRPQDAAAFERRVDHAIALACGRVAPSQMDRAAQAGACRQQLHAELQPQVREAMSAAVSQLASR